MTARFLTDTAADLLRRLDDDSIASKRPDGQEIVDSLHRAVVSDTGEVQWSEMCFCDPPLAHERATVLDTYFANLAVEPIAEYEHYDGQPFLEYLRAPRQDGTH